MDMESQVLLGFDFGTKRIGVAVGQTLTQTATPLPLLNAQQGVPDWKKIDVLVKHWRPHALIVGFPLNMDGTEQKITKAVKRFVKELKEHTQLTVHTLDERLSTKQVREEIFESGGYKALQKANIDSLSAKVILEHWMRK